MVNKKHENEYEDDNQEDVEVTNEELEMNEPDLEEVEAKEGNVIKTLREKLKTAETEKREALEEMQRAKADFLNAKRRLEEERVRDREKSKIKHVEELLPLCDSFQMAMSDKETWEKADGNWRKGIEGIHAQLQNLLTSYSVKAISPIGEKFDPYRHESLSTVPVENEEENDQVMQIIQTGYEMSKDNDETELIRPARVIIGIYEGGEK